MYLIEGSAAETIVDTTIDDLYLFLLLISSQKSAELKRHIFYAIQEVFLPKGYPDSVSKDYFSYQVWDSAQAFCSSITGALATLAVLKGVGVGDSSATPLAAAITWMLKDGTGMMGRILFAWLVSSDLDSNSKFWRLVADFLNDLANFLELIAALFPGIFLLLVILASVSKAVVGVAGGATRAAFVQHQARRDNLADVAAKDSSQETIVNLVALLVNLVLTPRVAGNTGLVWLLFVVFTILHLLANYRAVSVVSMETLNKSRLHLVVRTYLRLGKVPPVAWVNAKEPVVLWSGIRLNYKLGASLADVVKGMDWNKPNWNHKTILYYDHRRYKVDIALHMASNVAIQLKSAVAVEMVDWLIQTNWSEQSPILSVPHHVRGDVSASLTYIQALLEDSQVFSDFSQQLEEMGWVTSHLMLNTDEWRYSNITDTAEELEYRPHAN